MYLGLKKYKVIQWKATVHSLVSLHRIKKYFSPSYLRVYLLFIYLFFISADFFLSLQKNFPSLLPLCSTLPKVLHRVMTTFWWVMTVQKKSHHSRTDLKYRTANNGPDEWPHVGQAHGLDHGGPRQRFLCPISAWACRSRTSRQIFVDLSFGFEMGLMGFD